jgi:hypothetical protein
MNRGSAVGIATAYGLDDRVVEVRVPVESRIFLLNIVQTGSGAHRASYVMGTGGSFPGVKLTAHLQLVPRSRERESVHPLPPYVFVA